MSEDKFLLPYKFTAPASYCRCGVIVRACNAITSGSPRRRHTHGRKTRLECRLPLEVVNERGERGEGDGDPRETLTGGKARVFQQEHYFPCLALSPKAFSRGRCNEEEYARWTVLLLV